MLLDRLGAVIQTPSNRANRQALRSALVLSASDDSQMTLLEILPNYPTSELHVKGELLVETYFRLKQGVRGGTIGTVRKGSRLEKRVTNR